MPLAYLIDTVILIDHLHQVPEATQWLGRLKEGEAAISVITLAEILAGAESSEKNTILKLLDQFDCLAIDSDIAEQAAELRQQFRWKLPDAFQAALAKKYELKLVTRDEKAFPQDRHSFVLIPYKV